MAGEKISKSEHTAPTIVWLRQDLRVHDQPALHAAFERGAPVIPVYIWAPQEEGEWPYGGASKVWLHQSLSKLSESFEELGLELLIFDCTEKSSLALITNLAKTSGAGAVYWSRRYEPAIIERDKEIKAKLKSEGLTVETFNGSLLVEPWEILTKESRPYQVFTPFWRVLQRDYKHVKPLPKPRKSEKAQPSAATTKEIKEAKGFAKPVELAALKLLPKIHWDTGIKESWTPGEAGAIAQLKNFRKKTLASYKDARNLPEKEGVSRMSPHLHFGEISPRTIWQEISDDLHDGGVAPASKLAEAGSSYLREIAWREFSHHLLYHFPHTPAEPLRSQFDHFPWTRSKKNFVAWSKGLTGYPIVDAGMRELWHTGIMHNRVRMIAASFLVKDLLIPWQDGAHWFWDTLVDADLAQNTLGWQWTAGCGADAAPYFRIFNPVLQGEKFDPDGNYVRKWVPELKDMPKKMAAQAVGGAARSPGSRQGAPGQRLSQAHGRSLRSQSQSPCRVQRDEGLNKIIARYAP